MKASIIIAGRGSEGAEASLESALAQEFADSEILLALLGAADDAAELKAQFEGRAVLRVVPAERTMAAARNAALACAAGEYVAFLDAGDRWTPGTLARVAAMT